jgi:signal transduction histidine kinase
MLSWITFPRRRAPAGCRSGRSRWPAGAALAGSLWLAAGLFAEPPGPPIRGLPFTRSYSLEDIGYGPRSARLDFDRFGRVVVIHDDVYAVLNDSVWQNLAARAGPKGTAMSNVVQGPDGRMYYAGRASWGEAEVRADGLLHARPLLPPNPPAWVRSASFTDALVTRDGVYFVSAGGVAFRDVRRGETQLFEYRRIAKAFCVGDQVYVSAFDQPLSRINIAAHAVETLPDIQGMSTVVVVATPLDAGHALVALLDGRILVFDGQHLAPWEPQQRAGIAGSISVLHHLADGHIAIGVTGKGLWLVSKEGEIVLFLDQPQYHRITALANREPGVLWVATEDGIEKVLYSSSLTTFGQQLGLTVGWPIIERWQDKLYIASAGHLYAATTGAPGAPTRFELCPHEPPGGTWALAAWGPRMLAGGPDSIYSVETDGTLRRVAAVRDVAHLIMFDAEHCYAIGRTEIALLEWRDGAWTESAPRARGVTYPSVAHRVGRSVWIEMGGQVGRLWLHDGRPQLDIEPNANWTKRPWVNIGSVHDTVVLSAAAGERRFFDEARGAWSDAPKLRELLDRSPFWLPRMQTDEAGTIWATCEDGLVRFLPRGDDYDFDTNTFDPINDRYPVLQVLPGNDVWIFASQSLYHVEPRWTAGRRRDLTPVLVSLVDTAGEELLTTARSPADPIRYPFDRSGLTFRFYSGSDAWRRVPVYEYRQGAREAWTALAGSQLSFRGLHEGSYSVHVRMRDKSGRSGPVTTIDFAVLPPWYRSSLAYLLYASLVALLLVGVTRWSSYLERRRSRQLEEVVRERTRQLETTMAQLGEETRTSATLAERDRMANEIHDSVQQGLTGAILQLESTLTLPAVTGEVRSRLDVVRNMVSYARQEVQHAVWDMESPLLEGTEVGTALRNLTTFVGSVATSVEVDVVGEPFDLDRSTSHHLLRIAQEATTNAIRHSQAQRIAIRLEYESGSVTLEIHDDGIGFQPAEVLQERVGHLGLKGIRTRVKKLRGHLDINSSPNGGTTIRVNVPASVPPESSDHADPDRH